MPATMNMIASAMPAGVPQRDVLPARPTEAKDVTGSRSRSTFSTVLRSVQRADGTTARRQEPGPASSHGGPNAGRRKAELGKVDGESSDAERAGRRSVESSSDPGQESRKAEADSPPEDENGTAMARSETDVASPGLLGAVPAQEKTADAQASEDMLSSEYEGAEGSLGRVTSAGGEAETAPGMNILALASSSAAYGATVAMPDNLPDQRRMGTTVPSTQVQDIAVSGGDVAGRPLTDEQQLSLPIEEALSDGRAQADQQATPLSPARGEEALAAERPESTVRSASAAASPSTIAGGGDLVTPMIGESGLPAWEALGHHEQATSVEATHVPNALLDGLANQSGTMQHQDVGKAGAEGMRQPGLLHEPAASETEVSVLAVVDSGAAADRGSDELWSDLEADHRLWMDMRQAQEPEIPSAGGQESGAQRSEAVAAIAQSTRSAGSESDRQAAAAPAPSQPSGAAHSMDSPLPAMSRSVVLEVAQPDLGRVNVRVAVTNDLVHAHLSSDRLDVGQYLLNSQDRLQSALQASGLEMGQFRVDIDRQNAGRSFQQGQPQDQGRTWQPENAGSEQNHGMSELREHRGAAYAGMLNVVA